VTKLKSFLRTNGSLESGNCEKFRRKKKRESKCHLRRWPSEGRLQKPNLTRVTGI